LTWRSHACGSKTAPAATFGKIGSPVTICNLTVPWRERWKDQNINQLSPEPAKPSAICGIVALPVEVEAVMEFPQRALPVLGQLLLYVA